MNIELLKYAAQDKANDKLDSMNFYKRLTFVILQRLFNRKEYDEAESQALATVDEFDDLHTILGQIIYNILVNKSLSIIESEVAHG